VKRVEPQVFLLARPALNEEGLAAYLQAVGAQGWATDAPSAAEQLIEVAGRSCYRSFEPGLNPNVTRVREGSKSYLENILKVKHGSVIEHVNWTFAFFNVSRVFCFAEDHEVLTDEGWKRWPEVTGKEKFASMTPNGQLVYEKALELFVRDYLGMMYHVRSQQIDLLVTPNHRMWVQLVDTQAARRREEHFSIHQADQILHKRVRYQKGGVEWCGKRPDVIRIPDTMRTYRRSDTGTVVTRTYEGREFQIEPFARFLGFFVSEGSLAKHDTSISLFQNPGPVRDEMIKTLSKLGFHAVDTSSGTAAGRRMAIKNLPLHDWLAKHCGGDATRKRLPRVVFEWSPDLLGILLDALLKGDGNTHKENGHRVYYTSSPGLADDIQVLALKLGLAANVRVDDRTGEAHRIVTGAVIKNKKPGYIVSLLRPSRLYPHVNHNRHSSPNRWYFENGYNDCMVAYSGRVYCVKVPSGLLYVRRNGKPCWSGNTHEVVRHRAGTAISQESLRFVRLTEIPIWLPPEIRENPEALAIVEEAVETSEKAQQRLAEVLEIEGRPFHEKKVLTSAMRRVAPDGVATTLIWTANARTLRWVIEARTEPGAEVEIRLVFGKVAEIMTREAPNLFGDFKPIPLPDGTSQWQPEHSKV
jgi:thymidylate synthase ThyX